MASNSNFPITHFLIAIVFSLILVFFSWQNHLSWLTQPLVFILTPLRTPLSDTRRSLDHNFSSLRQFPHQKRLVKDLERQNAALAIQANRVTQLEKENAALKDAINSQISSQQKLIAVKIIGLTRFAIINHGSSSGINVGMPLVIGDTLLGIVTTTTTSSARVSLLTDPNLTLDAITNQGAIGQIKFQQDRLELTQVLQKENLTLDDRVFTKGSETLPDGLLIGTISKVQDDQSSVYKTAEIKLSATISDQQIAFIILE